MDRVGDSSQRHTVSHREGVFTDQLTGVRAKDVDAVDLAIPVFRIDFDPAGRFTIDNCPVDSRERKPV